MAQSSVCVQSGAWRRPSRVGVALLAAVVTASCGNGMMPYDGGRRDADQSCLPLSIEPAMSRAATDTAVFFRAVGGSGTAIFGLQGDTLGARIEPGGGLFTSRAGRITVVARDAVCGSEATAQLDVVGPFDVQPARVSVMPGGIVRYQATGNVGPVRYSVLARPTGAGGMGTVDAMGVFTAGMVNGTYLVAARDSGSGRQLQLTVDVGANMPLRAASPYLAVPSGQRIRLDWRGGSGVVEATVMGSGRGRVVTDTGALWFDATGVAPGSSDVMATDRFTRDTVRVRVFVGDTVGSPPLARGVLLSQGDLASGDLNGDGRPDLVVGHSERSAAAVEAGGVLIYYANEMGLYPDRPSMILEGDNALDHFGATLLVRDMNGDGIDDLIVGSPDEDLGEADRGGVRIYLGTRMGLETVPDRVLVGEDAAHRYGTSLAVEDVTGDGSPDLVVGAPGALSPFARTCFGGRVYLYRNTPTIRGVVESIAYQILDLRDTLVDDAEAPTRCATATIGAGRSLALVDMDMDGALDLAVGAPGVMLGATANVGAVMIYRGRSMDHRFESDPAWSIHLAPDLRVTNAGFGAGLDVVRETATGPASLVVRAPAATGRNAMGMMLANAGGLWTFPQGTLGAPGTPGSVDGGMANRARVLTTQQARGFAFGPVANAGLGIHASTGDVDADGRPDYVVGAVVSGNPGRILVFPAAQMVTGMGTLTGSQASMQMRNEMYGARVSVLRAPMGGAGLAAFALWRDTMAGPASGGIDYVPPGASAALVRIAMPSTIALPLFPAGDRSGAGLALGEFAPGVVQTVVGSSGAPSVADPTAMPPRPAGARRRTGTVDLFPPPPPAAPMPSVRSDRNTRDAAGLGAILAVLDFDGDGTPDIAVGDPGMSSGGPAPAGTVYANPTECIAQNAMGMSVTADVGGRGVVRVYSLVSGNLVERFRAVPRRERARAMTPTYLGNRFGAGLSVADVNGDNLDDLVISRTGLVDGNGVDVVLGRRYTDAMNRVVLVCNTSDAPFVAPADPADGSFFGAQVGGFGDLDGDGCDEFAVNLVRGAATRARAGLVVSFGWGSGTQCMGHTSPFVVRLVPDDRSLDDNVVGMLTTRANDEDDITAQATGTGSVIAQGQGDLVGDDGIADLVFRDTDLGFRGFRGPAVEILSGAYLRGLLTRVCPNRMCMSGTREGMFNDGDYHVIGLRVLDLPERRILPSDGLALRFGSSIVVAELSGDRFAELIVGSSDDSVMAPFAGALRVFRGGEAQLTQDTLLAGDPWLLAVGDLRERGAFSATAFGTSRGGGWLAAGAPASTRGGVGGEMGYAARWRVEVIR